MRRPSIVGEAWVDMILEVKEKSGKKYTLLRDGEPYCKCYPKDLREIGVPFDGEEEPVEVSGDNLFLFERTVLLPRAKKRALLLLGKKEYTSREMEQKLKRDGYPDTVVSEVLDWLKELRYVDDRSYGERYVLHLLPKCSEREIYQKMQQKGFEKEFIKDAYTTALESYRLEQGMEEDSESSPEQEAIRSFLRKKGYHPDALDGEKKQKMVMSLYRKGFSFSDIRAVMGFFETESEMYDE